MKKCSICGKSISDFVKKCPYCMTDLNIENEIEKSEKREYYLNLRASHARKSILISFILSLVIIFFKLLFGFRTPIATTRFELLLEPPCIIFAVFLITRYKIITILKSKKFLTTAIIISILFSLIHFFIYILLNGGISNLYIKYIMVAGIFNILTSIITGATMFTLIIEARFLFFQKKK